MCSTDDPRHGVDTEKLPRTAVIQAGLRTRRRRYPGTHMVKEFARIRKLVQLRIHVHKTKQKTNLGRVTYTEDDLAKATFHLNHYPIQSREYFRDTKLSRGDVAEEKLDNVRTWKHVRRVDLRWIAATPRLGRGESVETSNAAATTWIVRGGE